MKYFSTVEEFSAFRRQYDEKTSVWSALSISLFVGAVNTGVRGLKVNEGSFYSLALTHGNDYGYIHVTSTKPENNHAQTGFKSCGCWKSCVSQAPL